MTKTIKQNEAIALLGNDGFSELARIVFQDMSDTPQFKNDEPLCIMLGVYETHLEKWPYIIIEANCIKMDGGYDFGFQRLTLSTTEIPDLLLDRINEFNEAPSHKNQDSSAFTGSQIKKDSDESSDYLMIPLSHKP